MTETAMSPVEIAFTTRSAIACRFVVPGVLCDVRFDVFALAVFACSGSVAVRGKLAVSFRGRKYGRRVVGT